MNSDDWELEVAFIRWDFPPAERDTAQTVAAAFGAVVGPAILQLRPEHTMGKIVSWSHSDSLDTVELLMALEEEFLGHEMDDEFAAGFEQRTFREFVEYLSRTARTR
jgi:hypothetical protein